MTRSLWREPNEVSSSTIWSRRGESQLSGMGPMTLFLGRHPVIISASREYCLLAISTAGKWLRTALGAIYNPSRGRLPVPPIRTSRFNLYLQQIKLLLPSVFICSLRQILTHPIIANWMQKEEEAEGTEVTSVFGIYFCWRCHNMMAPLRASGVSLEFQCQTCGVQEIDFSQRYNEDCLLYSKELQSCTPLSTQTPGRAAPMRPPSSTRLPRRCRLSALSAGTTGRFTS